MPKKPDEKYNFIPADEVCAEWRKDPEYMREYLRQKPAFDRECAAHAARQKRRKARQAWLRGVATKLRGAWAYLTRASDGRAF